MRNDRASNARAAAADGPPRSRGILGWIERAGNRLPDPTTLFLLLAVLAFVLSAVGAWGGWSVRHPTDGRIVSVFNLASRDGLQWIFSTVVTNFTGFTPLGVVLVAMIGIGVAERTGLFAALLKGLMSVVPRRAVTPAVIFAGINSNVASDAGYVILPPLAAMLYASLGRHPLAGITAAFCGVSAGFSANFLISTLDPMLANITAEAAHLVDPGYTVYPTANYYFMCASVIVLTLTGWIVSERIVEPRLGTWRREDADPDALAADFGTLKPEEKRGLWAALAATLAVAALVCWLVIPRNGVLRALDPKISGIDSFKPFFDSIVTLVLVMFIVPGLAYGIVTRHIRDDRQAAKMMGQTMATMGHYIVLAFFAAQFIAWFRKSELGLIVAVVGADLLKSIHLTGIPLMIAFVILAAVINIIMSSASAKWFLMAPVFVPMMMILGKSPEATQGLYRIGDSVTNVITPLNAYFPILLAVSHRYMPSAGLGTFIAAMLPYSVAFFAVWTVMIIVWMTAGWPLGPDAPLLYATSQPGLTP